MLKIQKFSFDQIKLVKKYLFYEEQDLDGEYRKFDCDFAIGESWWKLAFKPDEIEQVDILLIEHELYEISLVTQGYPQNVAHDMTNEAGYNYQSEILKYYKNKENTLKRKNAGAILIEPNNEFDSITKNIKIDFEMEDK